MPICMYPAIAAPERSTPNYALQGERDILGSLRQGSAVVPGEVIFSSGSNLITGHGTYRDTNGTNAPNSDMPSQTDLQHNSGDDALKSAAVRTSLTGRVRIVNKLVYVEPPKARYYGNVGDTVVGRIIEVEQRRWRVDINSALLGNLALANVKLPGGELRRKSEDDERAMRSFMKEGDLIVAEVHEVHKDGSLQLHMPGTRTGKLGGGCLLRIPPSLVKRQKIHRHCLAVPRTTQSADGPVLPSSATSTEVVSVGLILGCNGYVWIGPSQAMDIGMRLAAPMESEQASARLDQLAERHAVSRVRNCILALTNNAMPVWETNILAACETSWLADQQQTTPDDEEEDDEDDMMDGSASHVTYNRTRNRIARLLRPDVSRRLVSLVQTKLGPTA